LDVAVVRLARIANFDDFEPLAREPGVRVRFVGDPRELEGADLLVLPGTKSTAADLGALRERGLADAVARRARAGGPVIGICGGYQMLGEALLDPRRVESAEPAVAGLGLLPVVTTFGSEKTTARVRARALAPVGPFAAAPGAALGPPGAGRLGPPRRRRAGRGGRPSDWTAGRPEGGSMTSADPVTVRASNAPWILVLIASAGLAVVPSPAAALSVQEAL